MIERRVVWRYSDEAHYHDSIECAVGSDGASPAVEFLEDLATGRWAEDPEFHPPKDEEQIHDHAKLLVKIEFVGMYGQPMSASSLNYLEEGIWEFKHGRRRLTYWDTPGDGSWTAKAKHRDVRERETLTPDLQQVPGGGFWWYPELDAVLRLGCAWPKDGTYAPQEKIADAVRLREEDCSHDQAP